jgi:uncharacterized membrane protein YphA (DoxX/SURF4 family)
LISLLTNDLSEAKTAAVNGWQRFWFLPRDPATLCVIRICVGLLLLYTHAVWTLDWGGFFGPQGWLDQAARREQYMMPAGVEPPPMIRWTWTHFDWIQNQSVLWGLHWAALGVFTLLVLGVWSRPVAFVSWLITISYTQRNPQAMFGLDGINTMLSMYLWLGPCGAWYSVDAWWKRKKEQGRGGDPVQRPIELSITANIAIRLIQCHMCLIYLFSALGKLQGESWWVGTAIWGAVANREYQSWDATWLATWPLLGSAITHITVLWELTYPVLVWPRLWRPLVLAMALGVHLGIGLWMGMMSFGLAMIVGNMAFVESYYVRTLLDRRVSRVPATEKTSGGRGRTT